MKKENKEIIEAVKNTLRTTKGKALKEDIYMLWLITKDKHKDLIGEFLEVLPEKKLNFISEIPENLPENFWNYIPEKFKSTKIKKIGHIEPVPDNKALQELFKGINERIDFTTPCTYNHVFFYPNNIIATNGYKLLNYHVKVKKEHQGVYNIAQNRGYRTTKTCVKYLGEDKCLPEYLTIKDCEALQWNSALLFQRDEFKKHTINTRNILSLIKATEYLFSEKDKILLKSGTIKATYYVDVIKVIIEKALLLGWEQADLYLKKDDYKAILLEKNTPFSKIFDWSTTVLMFTPTINELEGLIFYDLEQDKVKTNPKYLAKKNEKSRMRILKLLELENRNAEAELAMLNAKSQGTNESSVILQSTDLAGLEYKLLETDGMFHQLVGDPSMPFYIMLYGLPGSGKSTLTLQLAKYLAEKGLRVLYYAKEESGRHGFSYTLKEKLDRLNAYHENLFFANSLPENLQNYDVLVIDSVNDAGLTYEQLENLQNRYPQLSMLLIFQSTKNGNFRGEQKWQHLVDTVIKVEQGTATTGKNRFGKVGTVEVW